ncbi:MAG: bifunctional phosphoribosylaminoimidazolecarboxamide formyltransferase/IMP cyclohydrolase [Wenzhouxiangellaceae bacterium]|nr:bifunctional phosphoribosylaminoimidazolecarboxamide formyltransferase/IMP cyclohydrolase [Wenzhouxiangellaceae bacterium]
MNAATDLRRALISVSDKTGLAELGQALAGHGIEILSTGGSAKALRAAGVAVTEVSDFTGFPEIMGGRVKTLHPRIHGGILARAGLDDAAAAEHDLPPIDLVVVNLYPFAQTIARTDCSFDEAIENIDIGGPALLRAAAKNHDRVSVLCDPADYGRILDALPAVPDASARRALAGKAFAHTCAYDGQISQWLAARENGSDGLPAIVNLALEQRQALRYGENPHQRAALYVERERPAHGLAAAELLQGKALSFNNLLDADAAWRGVRALGEAAGCVIVKHTNPCGAALGAGPLQAFERALACDPTSAFGGIVAFNRPLDGAAAARLAERFFEVIIAPGFEPEARAALAAKTNLRLLVPAPANPDALELRRIDGGWLAQDIDPVDDPRAEFEVVTRRPPGDDEWRDLMLAWAVVAMVRSNAIVLAHDGATVGIGAGQMSRVDASRIAVMKAGDQGLALEGACLASDAFFPFADGLEAAAEAGVRAVIQPGGSKRDDEVIAAADRHGIAMLFTGRRHFRH